MRSLLMQAVIDGEAEKVCALLKAGADVNVTDQFGFTPLELAQFLGQVDCQRVLGYTPPTTFHLQTRDDEAPLEISLADFETYFDLVYRPFPFFESYQALQSVIKECSYILRQAWLAKDNHAYAKQFKNEIEKSLFAPVYVKWIDPIFEYGLFAAVDIPKGGFIGEYCGQVRQLSRRQPDQNAYCFHYPTRFWSWRYYVIDSMHEGNLMRFANHSDAPNIEPLCAVDRGLLRTIFVAKQDVPKDTQLMFNYGEDYWVKRRKV